MLDTNVVVSAHLNPDGLERAVLNWALDQGFFVSEPILKEYGDVLRRTKFKIDPDLVTESLGLIRSKATLVSPTRRVRESHDPDDNQFLECAEAAAAAKQLVFRGSLRKLAARVNHRDESPIVSLRYFLALVDDVKRDGVELSYISRRTYWRHIEQRLISEERKWMDSEASRPKSAGHSFEQKDVA